MAENIPQINALALLAPELDIGKEILDRFVVSSRILQIVDLIIGEPFKLTHLNEH